MDKLEKIIGHTYKNKDLLLRALTHSSFANENKIESYERLEFLGDTLLQTVVSLELFNRTDLNEGELSKLRAKLVSENYLEKVSDKIGITSNIYVGKSVRNISNSIKADVVESIIASLFLDSGFEASKKFIIDNIIVSDINIYQVYDEIVDYKTILQEKLQGKVERIEYKLIEKTGSEHKPVFKVELNIDKKRISVESGSSLKLAEQKCAKTAVEKMF